MNEYVHTAIGLFALTVIVAAFVYYGTLLASRGWHKGKKEFVDRMTADHCSEKD